MKAKNLFLSLAVFAVVTAVGLNSCNKTETDSVTEPSKTILSDYSNILASFASDFDDELISGEETDLKSASLASCFSVTIAKNTDGAFFPRNWTIEYLGGDCVFFSGNTKKGKIHVSLSDFWKNAGSLRTVTFEDYYFNGNKMEGVKTILNTGLNDKGNLTFAKTVTGASLKYPDGSSISWECKKQSEMIGGGSTFLFADDIYSVTGSVTGVNLDKKNYTLTITTPLIYKNRCFHPVSGTVKIDTTGGDLQTIDYGKGECDNLATLTVNGVTTEIKL